MNIDKKIKSVADFKNPEELKEYLETSDETKIFSNIDELGEVIKKEDIKEETSLSKAFKKLKF